MTAIFHQNTNIILDVLVRDFSSHSQIYFTIESIQRRAARFVFNDYSRNSSVSAMLADLNWPSLDERCIITDLTMFYKINFNVVNIHVSFSAEINLGFQGTRRSHDYKFMPLSSSVSAYKYSFFPRTIPAWNGLPFSVIHASSVNHFKASILYLTSSNQRL